LTLLTAKSVGKILRRNPVKLPAAREIITASYIFTGGEIFGRRLDFNQRKIYAPMLS
jgi:hypothetical protein